MAKINLDGADLLFAFGLDVVQRTILVHEDISVATVNKVSVGLDLLNRTSGPITLKLSTEGGDSDQSVVIYELIKMSKNPVNIIGYGPVFSAGAFLLQAAHKRFLTPEARVMVHPGSMSAEADARAFISYGAELQFNIERYIDLLASRSKLSRKEVDKLVKNDTFMSAQDAVRYGLADEILKYATYRKVK